MNRDLRHITQIFPTFLGLRLVPAGAFFLIVGGASPLVGPVPTAAQAVLAVLAVAAIWWIHLWYRREFGVVEPARLGWSRSWMFLLGLGVAVLAMSLGARSFGGTTTLVLLVVLTLFATAVLYALPRTLGGGTMAVALVAAVVLLGAIVIMAMGSDPLRFNYLGAFFSLAIGVVLCAAGVAEHLSMKQALHGAGTGDDV